MALSNVVTIEFGPLSDHNRGVIRHGDNKAQFGPDWDAAIDRYAVTIHTCDDPSEKFVFPDRDAAIIGALRALGIISY